MGTIRDALDWHKEQLISSFSEQITITHSGNSYPMLSAIGKTPWVIDDGNGIQVLSETRDYLVKKSDLPFDPERGDLIADENGDQYEVSVPSGDAPWRWANFSKTLLRIHTVKR